MTKTPSPTSEPKNTTPAAHDEHAGHDHSGHDHAGHDHSGHAHASLPIAPNSFVTVTIKWDVVEPAYQKGLRRFAQNAKSDGFRKGKVPLAMVEKMVDQQALIEYVLQQVLPEAYSEVIKAEKKQPISQPEIEPVSIEKGKDWVIKANFAETPEVKLGKYQDIVKKAQKEADKDIKDQEAELIKKAKEAPATDKTEKTDKAADAKDETPTLPTSLTDQQKDDARVRQIFKHLVEELKPQIPELLVRREADREIRRLLEQLDQLKLSVENYLQSRSMTAEQLRLEYLSAAATSLQLEFILAEIGKTEKITVEDKEIDEMMKQVFGDKVTPDQQQNDDYRSYIFNSIAKQKIIKHLLSL